MKAAIRISLLLLLAALLAGCETVQPWERRILSDYTMLPDRDPLAGKMAEHMFYSREAAEGGAGVGGGGCGCN